MTDFRFGGAHVDVSSTRFRAYATEARACALRVFDERLRAIESYAMEQVEDGLFELTSRALGPGTLYKFVLDGQELPDPYARFLPFGVHGPAQVCAAHRAARRPTPALSELVIYELHVGTFSETGTYAGARAHLPAVSRLGVNAIQLMPLASFAGQRGWGYDGVALYAPFAPYGTPDELRALVEEAHGLGLSVLLDVVYNHLGPAGNYLPRYSARYFTRDTHTSWGVAPAMAEPCMRAYVLDNARYWLEEFGFDGFRLDATHAIVDPSPTHLLRELAAVVREVAPDAILIAEDDRNDPDAVHGCGIDAVWADDFHHQLSVTLTRERDGYYAAYEGGARDLARTIERGWFYEGQPYPTTQAPRGAPADALPAGAFVYCIDNHDQVGNRAFGDRLSARVPVDAYALASTLLLFLPMTPMLFMGQEWGASTPFLFFSDHDAELGEQVSRGRREEFKAFRAFRDPTEREGIPDPQAEATFARSKLRWEERDMPRHAAVLGLVERLLTLRRTDPVLVRSGRADMTVTSQGDVLIVRRSAAGASRVLLANLGTSAVRLGTLPVPAGGTELLSTREQHAPGLLAPLEARIVAVPPEHAR